MHVYILFAHPSRQSFNRAVLASFCAGLADAHHTYEVGDLYEMGFEVALDLAQYEREVGLDPEAPVPPDVQAEQEKIARADALAFIYPVWWSDCPAVLKGWFDRVFTYGYAYYYDDAENRHTEIAVKKAVVICSAGHTEAHLEETGIAGSMRHIMLNDRLLGVGVQSATMEILGGMMPGDDTWRARNLQRAYARGRDL
jgi:NAD(P)H dehydrogenase (quinone)